MNNHFKVCSMCRKEKPLSAFSLKLAAPDKKQAYCQECNRLYQAERARRQKVSGPVMDKLAASGLKAKNTQSVLRLQFALGIMEEGLKILQREINEIRGLL